MKVCFDITKQPVLEIAEGSQTEMVLSVGMDKSGIPLITISNDGNPICYRLPEELSDGHIRLLEWQIWEKIYSRHKLYLLKRRTGILLIFYKTQSV